MNITNDDYHAWRDNEVTKRFLRDMAAVLENAKGERLLGNPDTVLRLAYERNAEMTVLGNVIDWKPSELIEENS